MKKYSVVIDGVKVEATFNESRVKTADFNGDLTVKIAEGSLTEVHDIAKTFALSNIVKMGDDQNSFVINYVKESDCDELFEQVCDAFEYSYCTM